MSRSVIRELNHDYYEHSPSAYLRTRITLLVALGDSGLPIHRSLDTGVSAWGVSAQGSSAYDYDHIEEYAVVESISVMYLAAEAFIRTFFAHAEGAGCPPLALASLTNFRDFKKRIQRLLTVPPDLDVVRDICRGTSDRPSDVPEPVWAEDGEVVVFLLQQAAAMLLNNAHVYNSTKHGLAVLPRRSTIKVGRDDDPLIQHSGPSVRFLRRGPGKPASDNEWSEVVQFEFPSINLAFASAFADELEAIHRVGASRHHGKGLELDLRPRALIEYLQAVPFEGGRPGLLRLALNRSLTVPPHASASDESRLIHP